MLYVLLFSPSLQNGMPNRVYQLLQPPLLIWKLGVKHALPSESHDAKFHGRWKVRHPLTDMSRRKTPHIQLNRQTGRHLTSRGHWRGMARAN